MSTWVCHRGNLDWLDHPAFNWVNTMIGNVKNSLRAVAIRSERSIYQGILRNTASGLIIV